MVSEPSPLSTPAPFANWSVYWLMKWMSSGSDKKSLAEYEFHFLPFKQYWRRSADKLERIDDEIHSSDAFIRAHEDLQRSKSEEGCTLDRVVCALVFWSDSTHLASFGDASVWPLYMFFGNQSKYVRGRPNSGACHHVSYIPKLPDKIQYFFSALTGKLLSDDAQTLCRRDLMHSVWRLLLDADFRHQVHRWYHAKGVPATLTHSADYPEKVLFATIRSMGDCLRPRCKIYKPLVSELGMILVTTARNAIYKAGSAIKTRVNAFSEFAEAVSEDIAPLQRNFFTMFVPDLMHEFEQDEWKRFFTYLLTRLLEVIGASAVQEMNRRYRLMPTFGCFTIRKKSVDASALKKLAAPDYEEYVRTAMPVFEKLFQTRSMISSFKTCCLHWPTGTPSQNFYWFFVNVCGFYATKELAREEAARNRRRAAAIKAGQPVPLATAGKLKKTLNFFTYKHHALGDYPDTIVMFGSTDSDSTQQSLNHRRVKRFYARTNKNNSVKQITNLHRRKEAMRSRKEWTHKTLKKKRQSEAAVLETQSEPLTYTPPEYHHDISRSQNFPSTLSRWANLNKVDPVMKDFYRKLQGHLYSRLLKPGYADVKQTFTNAERQNFLLLGSRIYRLEIFQVNCTTYDVFSHAAVLHRVNGQLPTTRIVEFLLVRWLRLHTIWKGGFEARRLHRIEFLPESDANAFGFLDPDNVIRGSHLIPAFAYGLQEDASLYYSDVYKYYYVRFFVDRDMYMRYRGLGVGHSFIRVPQDQSAVSPSCDADDDDDIPDVVPDGADDDDDDDEEEGGERWRRSREGRG
ncbi:hypothetical protein EIP91_007802 [Steccherinum ochraceum]|uniref:Uncharacterized protein n=1 Tax=Steccherinum ochraceum TaxID=92696 RepID=A0A4R0RHS2_9APHY|nr:hypothetical protein EIP91_007802 [Steccherinum ochraceum]